MGRGQTLRGKRATYRPSTLLLLGWTINGNAESIFYLNRRMTSLFPGRLRACRATFAFAAN